MKRKTRILLMIVAALIVLGAGAFALINHNLKKLAGTPVADVDLNALSDGVYTGHYSSFPVSATVEVTVLDHQIVSIDLVEHINGQGGPAEVIPQHVVQAQSLQVDAISGATYSSKVILLAIENALVNPSH